MNKYLTFPGQQPVYLGDIDFMQTAVRNTLFYLMKNITGNEACNGILWGVEINNSGAGATYTAGVVSILGEILPIAGGVVEGDDTSQLYFQISSTLSGERTFGDGQSHKCYEQRYAYISKYATAYPVESFPRINSLSGNQAQVYAFTDKPQTTVYYSKLVQTGGALYLMIRNLASVEVQDSYFYGSIQGLPANILSKFTNPSAPRNCLVQVKAAGSGASLISYTLQAYFSVAEGELTIHIDNPDGLTFNFDNEVSQILPVF